MTGIDGELSASAEEILRQDRSALAPLLGLSDHALDASLEGVGVPT